MSTSENVNASSGGGPRTRNQPTSGSRCNRSSGSATVYSAERSISMLAVSKMKAYCSLLDVRPSRGPIT